MYDCLVNNGPVDLKLNVIYQHSPVSVCCFVRDQILFTLKKHLIKPFLDTKLTSLKIPDFKLVFIFTFCAYIVYPLVIFGSNVIFINIFVNQHVPQAHFSPCPTTILLRPYDLYNEGIINYKINYKIELKFLNIFQIFILSFGMITLFRFSCLHLCNHIRYVRFNTNLSLISKKKTLNELHFSSIFWSLLMLGLLFELDNNQILLFVILMNPNFGRLFELLFKFSKIVSQIIFTTLSFYMFSICILLGAYVTYFDVQRHSFEPWTTAQSSK